MSTQREYSVGYYSLWSTAAGSYPVQWAVQELILCKNCSRWLLEQAGRQCSHCRLSHCLLIGSGQHASRPGCLPPVSSQIKMFLAQSLKLYRSFVFIRIALSQRFRCEWKWSAVVSATYQSRSRSSEPFFDWVADTHIYVTGETSIQDDPRLS